MSTVTAYAATSATEPLTKTTITRRDVGPHDVRFDIHFAGICHPTSTPCAPSGASRAIRWFPGHEIAGVVTEVGSQVTRHKVGDRVGVGCFVDSCRECDHCLAGLEQYCTGGGNIGTYNAIGRDGQPTYGGYSGSIVVDENYVLRIPDARPRCRRTAVVRGHHHLLAAAALECRAGQADRRRGPRRSGPHGGQTRRGDGRRGDGAVAEPEEDGGRPATGRQPLLRDRRPRHVQSCATPST